MEDPDGSTFDREHRLITTASVLRAIVEVLPDGKLRTLAEKFEGKRFNSPNDIVVGPDGALYFTDPTLDLPKGQKQEIPFQGVYRLAPDGGVRLLVKDLKQPNGLAFSPDGKRLYVDDTKGRDIRVYDVGSHGEITNGRVFGKEEGRDGVPDGMRVDAKGNLYVTGPGGIWVWDPGGKRLGIIVLPETAANLTWGDADYKALYITATKSVYRLRTKAQGFVPAVHPYETAGAQEWKVRGLAASSSDLNAAATALGKACDLAPGDEEACYFYARNLYALGHYQAARDPFEKALRASPPAMAAKVHRAVALNFAAMGSGAEAEQHFVKAIQLAGRKPGGTEDPRVDYGAFLFRQGRTADALQPLEQAVRDVPSSARANLELGRVLLHLNQVEAAAARLEKSVEIAPRDFNAHLLLGRAYLRLGRTSEGEKEIQLGRDGWGVKR
jgi:gluconolactonase